MVNMSSFKQHVHRSLLQREMIGGIPQAGLFFIFIFGLIFVYGLKIYWALVPLAILYFFMRHLTKLDQFLIDMVLDNIMQKDKLIP